MIVGIGTDIVEVDRIRDSHKKFGEKFIDRILLPAEREYCLSHTDPCLLYTSPSPRDRQK